MHRFEQLVADGRAAASGADGTKAIELFVEAEALWRGDALAEFVYEDFAIAPASRLSELRLAAIEERLDLELKLGRHHSAIGELEALVAAHPLRERTRGLLMLALYRGGRQADALRTFQEGRHVLGEELGLDPGPELRQLEAAILAHDPSLGAPTGAAANELTFTIPAPLTPLVGRDGELRDLAQLVHDHRLVTLVGPGGVGKTRLAIEVARDHGTSMRFGSCLVELAPVGAPAGVRAAIASALELPDPDRLAPLIGDRELLLVLDNCEHVIAEAAEVAEDLLRRCPALRLVATSREGLRVGGETLWPVPPLAEDDAVELFLARAQATGATVERSDELLAAVSEICERLDGLPLAIELAAARTRAFPIQQISSRLHDRFRLLTGGSRTALPRQQTLRAVVDWSYDLLFDDEQRVFERLSVFPGGCDLATAEAVCADETLAASELDDIILALVDKSLVIAVPMGDELRFSQLQTLAQYGREKLAERGDAERIRSAMASHFARLCAESAAAYLGERQRSWLIAIEREQDNLRGALEWAVDNDDAETALMIAGGAGWPHWLKGTAVEARRWLDAAFGCAGEVSDEVRALALVSRGLIRFQLGESAGVDDDFETALATFRAAGDVASTAMAHSFYAEVAAARGDLDEARRRRRDQLAFYLENSDDPFVLAAHAYSRGKLAVLDGDLAEAERSYRAAADGFSKIDRPMMRSMSVGMVADFDERNGDYQGAIDRLNEAVEINDALGLRGFNGAVLARLGWAHLQNGDITRAELAYARSLDLARRLAHPSVVFLALVGLAAVHRLEGRTAEAAAAATEALEMHAAGGPRPGRLSNRIDAHADVVAGAAVCWVVLGSLAAEAGDSAESKRLLEQADRNRHECGIPVPRFEVAYRR